MKRPQLSIITVVSRSDVYDRCLLQSVVENRKKHNIEIIPIYNEHNQYSASTALNLGIEVAKSDYLIIAHQDIRLLYDWFDKLYDVLDNLPDDFAVLGSAGIALQYTIDDIGKWGGSLGTKTVAVGSVWDADEKLTEVPYWDGTKELTKIHCADECLLVLNKKTGLQFDLAFTGFHFYGVDLCLQARAAGYGVYGVHLPIIHYGKYSASFNSDHKYWVYLRLLHHKWGLRFPELLGTHFHWQLSDTVSELTSYIDVDLKSNDGIGVYIKAMGLGKVKIRK